MLSNNRDISKNGTERSLYSDNSILYRSDYNSISHPRPNPRRMEKILIQALTTTGLLSYTLGIFLNLGNYKSLILFILGVVFMVLKILRYAIVTWQDYKKREIELKMMEEDSKE
jgi:hypothetical protein